MNRNFVPALGYSILTPLYDVLVRLTTREHHFKSLLISYARIQDGESVLDVGCGTGTLLQLAAALGPNASYSGLDADPKMLKMAKDKLGPAIKLHQGFSTQLPIEDESIDCVLSTLFFHHLATDVKIATLTEIHRVLKKGGRLMIADWGKQEWPWMRPLFYLIQFLDGFATTSDNARGKIPEFMSKTGLKNCEELDRVPTVFGSLSIYSGRKT